MTSQPSEVDYIQPIDQTPDLSADASVPGSEIPPSHGGGYQQQPPGDEDSSAPPEITHPPKLDHGVPGSEIPPSHGGGFQQQPPDDDSTAPSDLTSATHLASTLPEAPEGPGVPPSRDTRLDYPGRALPPKGTPGLAIGVAIAIVIIILAAAAIFWSGDDGGDDGPDGAAALRIDKENTTAMYIYEPNPGLHLAVVIMNTGDGIAELATYDLYVTVHVEGVKEGDVRKPLAGSITKGGSMTFELSVAPMALDPGETMEVAIKLRKGENLKVVDLYEFNLVVQM